MTYDLKEKGGLTKNKLPLGYYVITIAAGANAKKI
jgi:hypothetical protein